jgi:putative membrane protein
MNIFSQVCFSLGAVIHILIFTLEAMIWGTPYANKAFGVTKEQAEELRLFAFNQGFYNLFLTLEVFVGLGLYRFSPYPEAGMGLMIFGATSMLMASLILFISSPKLLRAVVIQGGVPLLGLLGLLF